MARKVFYGWWIVVATSLIHFWTAGIFVYGFTAFFNPLVQEFGWSYTATSFAASFRSLESGIAAPAVGFLTDRFGPRKLILLGAIIAGAGCILLSRISSLWGFYVTFIVLSVGASLSHPLPGWSAVTNWFFRRRGLAMGIVVAATGVSGVLIPLVNWLIETYTWRVAFIVGGAGMWLIGIPLSLVLRHHPEQYGQLPDGEKRPPAAVPESTKAATATPVQSGLSVREAARTRAFWMLTLTSTATGAGLHTASVHIMPYLISVDMSRNTASAIAASMVVSSVLGRLGFGWLGDRMNKRYLLAGAVIMQALGMLVLAYTRTVPYAIVFLLLMGPGFGGTVTLRLAMQGDYFGRKAFGSIQGLSQGIHMVGTMLGPLFAGWIFDVRGSYQFAWLVFSVMLVAAIPPALLATRPKPVLAQPRLAVEGAK